jgi:hypothetical protein
MGVRRKEETMEWQAVEERLMRVYETIEEVEEQDETFRAIAAEFAATGDAGMAARVLAWAEIQ